MSFTLPFTISPEAEDYLKARSVPAGNEAGLSVANNFEVRDRDGKVTDRYEGLYFTIGYDKPGHWSGTRVPFGSIEFWIPENTLNELRGKTLQVIRRYEGEKQPGKIQNLLVAV
jgi:pyridoxine/pyridoxamine 5'-phosphate oxidase